MKLVLLNILALITLLFSAREEPRKEEVFKVYLKDSLLHQVELIYDDNNLPDQYHAFIRSPVCDDGLCKMVSLHVYWDLLGHFKQFKVPVGVPLTKFDHLEFTTHDYLKLKDILSDHGSLLGKYKVEELIDQNTRLVSDSVDATTGATKETVKKAVVSGAVYSTYTLWHAVHGQISHKIDSLTGSMLNAKLLRKFLNSDSHHYHYYALGHLSSSELDKFQKDLINTIARGNIFVAKKALDKLSEKQLQDDQWQLALTQLYDSLIYQKQQFILQALKGKVIQSPALGQLTSYLPQQSETQVRQILTLVQNNQENADDAVVKNVSALLYNQNPAFIDLGLNTLKVIQKKNQTAQNTIKDYEKKDD
ncbi:MAG: hypothetical protein ACNS62_05110 [Candidatus Cyclobacteriaceae bacterium M3_2C_046]